MAASGGVQSLDRALDLLELLAEAGGEARLSDLGRSAALPPATIHRLLGVLQARGYVRQGDSRRYGLGPRLLALGDLAGRMVGTWARPVLAELTAATGETSNLAILEGDEMVYVAQAPSAHSLRMFTQVGRRVPLHCTGVGKAVLAALPEPAQAEVVDRLVLRPATPRSHTGTGVLHRDLAATRARGWALDDGEQELGVCCVAVAVPSEPALFAVSVSAPEVRLSPDRAHEVVPDLAVAAERLGELLRGRS